MARQYKKAIKKRDRSVAKSGIAKDVSITRPVLISFNKTTTRFLLIVLGFYFIASFFKIHTSSIGMWEEVFGNPEPESVISGKPRPIRQDEWMVFTPMLIGQYESGMPLRNISVGDGRAPLILGLPVRDIVTILRPAMWPYFIFDAERAFAFSWNFTIFFFLITTFLLFMLLTGNKFWISLFGSFLIFLSSGMQWWSYSIGSFMLYLNTITISFIYLLYSTKIRALIIASLALLFSSYSFVTGSLYPPFQIPLVYLYLFIIIGYILREKNFKTIAEIKWVRAGIFSVTAAILLTFFYHYYGLAKGTFDIMLNTAYPGKRVSTGGDLIDGKFFSEFFGMYMTDVHVPQQWLNICEESGFLIFFPIIFYGMAYNYFKSRKFDILQVAISTYILISTVYILFGFPLFLSKISLFSMSQACRVLPVLEVGNCVLLICWLGSKELKHANRFSWLEFGVLLLATLIFGRLVCNNINSKTDNFFSSEQVAVVTFLITVMYLLIRYKHVKYATAVLVLLLLGINISNLIVNPLTAGLSSVSTNPLVGMTREIHQTDPRARWAVFGNQTLANLLKASGVNIFNGVKSVPLLKEMSILDPAGKNNLIYNRYAHINMATYIDGKDSVAFKLNVADNYSILMDPCSPRLKELEIKYFLFSYRPQGAEIRCMVPVKDTLGLFVYKRGDQ